MEAVFPMKKMLLEYNEEEKKYTHTHKHICILKNCFSIARCNLRYLLPICE